MGIGVLIEQPGAAALEISEYLGRGTNNIAELTAIKRGLEKQPRGQPIVVYTDSQYAIGVLALGYRARANQPLVASILALIGEFDRVYFVKVLGHSGIRGNERSDELARAAATRRPIQAGRTQGTEPPAKTDAERVWVAARVLETALCNDMSGLVEMLVRLAYRELVGADAFNDGWLAAFEEGGEEQVERFCQEDQTKKRTVPW